MRGDGGMQVRLQRALTGTGSRQEGWVERREDGEKVFLGEARLKRRFDSTCQVVKRFGQDVT